MLFLVSPSLSFCLCVCKRNMIHCATAAESYCLLFPLSNTRTQPRSSSQLPFPAFLGLKMNRFWKSLIAPRLLFLRLVSWENKMSDSPSLSKKNLNFLLSCHDQSLLRITSVLFFYSWVTRPIYRFAAEAKSELCRKCLMKGKFTQVRSFYSSTFNQRPFNCCTANKALPLYYALNRN